jgi:hypothetical protein
MRPVSVSTLVARGTLDEHVHAMVREKFDVGSAALFAYEVLRRMRMEEGG